MAAIIGLEDSVVENVCAEIDGFVKCANYNCPGQVVISGTLAGVDQACQALKEAGAKRVVPLKVSGPFHSSLLKGAGDKLAKVLEDVEIKDIETPYVSNVTAEFVNDKAQVKDLLTRQISSSVRWQQSIEAMLADGYDVFVEIGPGKTLTNFMKKIDTEKKATVYNIEKVEDLDTVAEALKNLQ